MSTDEDTVVAPPTGGEAPPDQVEPSPTSPTPVLAGRYRLARRIGKGGMGEVMAARDEQVGRDVAIKRMRAAAPNARAIQRFLREASIQGRLEHPAIVPVHEIGRDSDGLPFFVMKKLTGTTLGKIIADPEQRASFGLQRILRAFAEVCLAIEFAHVQGIVQGADGAVAAAISGGRLRDRGGRRRLDRRDAARHRRARPTAAARSSARRAYDGPWRSGSVHNRRLEGARGDRVVFLDADLVPGTSLRPRARADVGAQ